MNRKDAINSEFSADCLSFIWRQGTVAGQKKTGTPREASAKLLSNKFT